MTEIRIVEDGFVYEREQNLYQAQHAAHAGIIAEVGKGLLDLQEKVEALVKSHPLYQYHSGWYVDGILLGVDGSPDGIVQFVDDFPSYLPFRQQPRGAVAAPEESQ